MNYLNLSNKKKAELCRKNYISWKNTELTNSGFFIVFNDFKDKNILKKINGNALKLYLFLGINSKNDTGESWYTIDSISKYFGKSHRTISYWIKELEDLNLIQRFQLEPNDVAHTFLQPY